jgi:renalase
VTRARAGSRVSTAIVGGGIAGLACADLLRGGRGTTVVYERSRGVGGRCATRRVSGQPVDHGASFLHGTNDEFLAAARGVPRAGILDGWPRLVEGAGPPCLPRAFEPHEHRLAYEGGLTSFPKHLAAGIDLRLGTHVTGLSGDSGGVRVHEEGGASIRADVVVLAVPPPSALKLIGPFAGDGREAAAMCALLGMIGAQACLTVLAGYPLEVARPSWDVCYPEDSPALQMISHDSAKRAAPRCVVLVIQARPCWSSAHLAEREETWSSVLVQEAANVLGAWVGSPSWVQAHRWRFAHSDRGSELSRPITLRVRGGGRLIVTGESFAAGGGIEAAWLAGRASARRVLEEE